MSSIAAPRCSADDSSRRLDLMGRFVCNTWDEAVNNGGPPFDVVIIGGGMFGGLLQRT